MPGIISFDKFVQQSETQAAAETTSPTPKPPQDIAPEAGDAEIRDRMLVFSLLSRYPNVGGRLYEILSSIPGEDRLPRARQLGHSFGLYLFKQQKLASPVKDLPDALERLILPAISPMAKVQLMDNVLAVTASKINIKPKKPQDTSCMFLLGTLDGLLSAAEQGTHHIEKLCCEAEGAECCKFEFRNG